MLDVLTGYALQHDLGLVALAAGVCVVSSFFALALYSQSRDERGVRWVWPAASGLAAGSGLWAAHFIALLAHRPAPHVGYVAGLALGSWAIAVIGVGAAFSAAAAWPTLRGRLAGGAVLGLSLCAMHVVGALAFQTRGVLIWNPGLIALTVALGAGLGAGALAAAGGAHTRVRALGGAALLALTLCTVHFAAMAAMTLQLDPEMAATPALYPVLAVCIILAALVGVVLLAAGAALLESRSQRRAYDALSAIVDGCAAARYEAEAALRARNEFLALMSHELRRPLNGVRGVAQALDATSLSPEQRDMLRTLDRSAHALQRHIALLAEPPGTEIGWTPSRAEVPQPAAPAAPVAVHQEAARGPLKVLIAEDHPVNRKVLTMMLSPLELELVFAENGSEAVDAFRTQAFDLVLMDMQMPQMDGLEATRAIREFERRTGAKRTPVVMLTAHALSEHVEASREAGADRHVTKPVAAAELFAVFNELCGPAHENSRAA